MLVSLIMSVVLLLAAIAFGAWAFAGRQDYKNNSDQKAAAAAEEAKREAEEAAAVRFAEEEKKPLKTHKAPEQFGGVAIQYPKTWSGYVIEKSTGSTAVNNFFHPNVVPDTSNRGSLYALRVQVVDQTYDKVIASYNNAVEAERLSASPYSLPKVPDVVGTRLDGQIDTNKQGSMIVLPVRNMTLKVWTELPNHLDDFNNIILPNLTYSP